MSRVDGVSVWAPTFCKLSIKLDKLYETLDRFESKFDRKLDTLPTRRFTAWVAAISTEVTITVIVLAVVFSAAYGH